MPYRRTARSDAVRSASRAKLMKAALDLLSRRGYEATTMQDVVAAAGTSIGNAYFYFGSKDQLIREAIEATIAEVLAESERVASAFPPGPRRLAVLLALNLSSITRDRERVASALAATDQQLQTLALAEDPAIDALVRHLEAWLPHRSAEIPGIASMIHGGNRIYMLRRLRGKLDTTPEEAIRFMIGWSLRALEVPAAEIDDAIAAALAVVPSSKPPTAARKRVRRATS